MAKISYERLGKHCFRVGGINALQEANASVCEVMALGKDGVGMRGVLALEDTEER
jgi:hypothetical protein